MWNIKINKLIPLQISPSGGFPGTGVFLVCALILIISTVSLQFHHSKGCILDNVSWIFTNGESPFPPSVSPRLVYCFLTRWLSSVPHQPNKSLTSQTNTFIAVKLNVDAREALVSFRFHELLIVGVVIRSLCTFWRKQTITFIFNK